MPTSFPQVDGIIVQRFRPFRWTSSTVFHSFFFFLPFRGISDFGSDGSGGGTEVDTDRLAFVVILLFSYGNQEDRRVKFKD